jgi:hypothetical protein
MASTSLFSADYWQTLQITKKDIEFLHTYLFEHETPLTARELTHVLIKERIRVEQEAVAARRQGRGQIYLPKEMYREGDELVFPALNWVKGRVIETRAGVNPQLETFAVLSVEMEDGANRLFAGGLADHALNFAPTQDETAADLDPDAITRDSGADLERRLESALFADENLVRIAGRWFPKALLLDVNAGHLNLAEAVLDMASGDPLPTEALMRDVELPAGVNSKLAAFSLNYALQEDGRFDEVGPAGQVLWCLQRLEPEGVRQVPPALQYVEVPHDRSVLTHQMLSFEAQLDDELSDLPVQNGLKDVTVSLLYPHWRAGTLPVSGRARSLFPTAYESPRVRFTLVDARTGKKMPAWVVREHGYVYGLSDWYKASDMVPGGLVRISHGDQPGEVKVEALAHRATRDWVRTVIVGADGGLVFALLKQQISVEFNERMVVFIPDPAAVDQVRDQIAKKRQAFQETVKMLVRLLVGLNPQGHVHAQELYAALNIVRRTPPAPLLSLLANDPEFIHVGDLHYRLNE